MSDNEGFFGPMEDINSLPNIQKKEKPVIKKTRRGDGDRRRKQQANKNMIRRVARETFDYMKKQLKESNKKKEKTLFV